METPLFEIHHPQPTSGTALPFPPTTRLTAFVRPAKIRNPILLCRRAGRQASRLVSIKDEHARLVEESQAMQAKSDSLEVSSRTADGRTRRIEFLQNSSAPHCERTSGACRCISIAYTVQLCCQADYPRCVQSTSHARPYPQESFGTPTDVCIVATLLHGLKRPAAPPGHLGQCHGKQEKSDKCGAEAPMKPLCRSRHTNSNRNKKTAFTTARMTAPPPHI